MFAILDGRTKEQKLADAKSLLIENGYLVKDPPLEKYNVKTLPQLVRFFYDVMAQHNPKFKTVYAGNNKKDCAIARKLIEARTDLGCSKERAYIECCKFIEILFSHEPYIGLSFPITSMSVLSQDSMSWVVEKVWHIYEGIHNEVSKDEESAWLDGIYRQQEKEISERSDEEAVKQLDEVIERYGKSE